MFLQKKKTELSLFCVLPVNYKEMYVYSQIYFDVSPGNGRQASSENRTQGGKTNPE